MFTQTLAALSFAAIALADSETFGLVVIRSGSQYQYSSISVVDGAFSIGTSDYVEGAITDDGFFKLSDGSYAVVKGDGIYTGAEGSSPFSISSGYLNYEGSSAFSIEDDKVYADSTHGTSVALRASLSSGSAAADFSPSGSTNNGTDSNSTNTSTTTTTFDIQTDTNGAAVLSSAGVGALLAAAAALLL